MPLPPLTREELAILGAHVMYRTLQAEPGDRFEIIASELNNSDRALSLPILTHAVYQLAGFIDIAFGKRRIELLFEIDDNIAALPPKPITRKNPE